MKITSEFRFQPVSDEEILSTVRNFDSSKATTYKNIPMKLFKQHIDLYNHVLTNLFNDMIESCIFPDNLKKADITPVHKKRETTNMCNYRPVSVLPTLSKLFEKLLYQQIYSYINQYLSNKLCGYREGYSAQHCLSVMIESINNSLDKGGKAGALLLTDLSKAFDCILHDLLIAKLHAYGFSIESLRLINNYLSNRKQRTKIDSQFSSWEDIIFGVPQGSILGPLFYNINSNDIFFFADQSEIANYADDNTPYACAGSIEEVIKKLETDANLLL